MCRDSEQNAALEGSSDMGGGLGLSGSTLQNASGTDYIGHIFNFTCIANVCIASKIDSPIFNMALNILCISLERILQFSLLLINELFYNQLFEVISMQKWYNISKP